MSEPGVRDTSIDALRYITERGITGTQERRITSIVAAAGRDLTRREIEHLTGIAINAVSGRVNTLVKLGHLAELPKRKCGVSGRSAHPVTIPPTQGELFR